MIVDGLHAQGILAWHYCAEYFLVLTKKEKENAEFYVPSRWLEMGCDFGDYWRQALFRGPRHRPKTHERQRQMLSNTPPLQAKF